MAQSPTTPKPAAQQAQASTAASTPTPVTTTQAPAAASTPKAAATRRIAHYTQYVIRLHEKSAVSLDDLEEVLQGRADEAGEQLVVKAPGENARYKGTVLIVGPKSATRVSGAERARKLYEKAVAAAVKAGLDPKTLGQ